MYVHYSYCHKKKSFQMDKKNILVLIQRHSKEFWSHFDTLYCQDCTVYGKTAENLKIARFLLSVLTAGGVIIHNMLTDHSNL